MKICFITDGGRQMGMGHVQQSTALACVLRTNANVCFLTKSDDTVLTAIRESGFEATGLRSDAEILQHLTTLNPDVIVFDKIDVEEKLARDIKNALKARLVIFTNLTGANKYADVAVLQRAADLTVDIGNRFKNVAYTDNDTNTLYCYGPKYWVLRPEFYEYKSKGKASSRKPEHILLTFGGSDPSNLTSAVLEELLGLDRMLWIDVILGAHFGHDDTVMHVLERHPGKRANVTVHRNIKNVADLMYKADLTVTSPGLSMFEALCVGTPVIVIPQDALQRDTYRGFMRMLERDEISKLGGMIARGEFTYPHEAHIAMMEIGEGVPELVEVILRPVRAVGEHLQSNS
jgi:spore coat polysaccharide biosynthesis predicted glycosyltransferase SpsG